MNTDEVEIIAVEKDKRLVIVKHMPKSQRELIDALCIYWTVNEIHFSITEVLRYEKPQRVFYSVLWEEGERE
jgi:hypothetical protein